MKTIGWITAGAALSLAGAAQAAEQVTIGVPNWPSARATAHVLQEIAAQELGLEVSLVPGTNPVIFAAMDRGRGDIDVHPEVWLPNQSNLTEEYVDDKGTVVLSDNTYEGTQGYCVSEATMEATGVSSAMDLANPAVAEQFDRDDDGQGEIWIGAPGWASVNVEKVKAREYGFDQFFDLTTSDETIAYAELADAVTKGEPYVFFCYQPHHIFGMYDLAMLEEPAYDESSWNMLQPDEDPAWFENSSVSTAWPAAQIQLAYAKSLEERAPIVIDLLQNFELSTELANEWTYELVVNGRDPDAFAKAWVENHPDEVDAWLGLM